MLSVLIPVYNYNITDLVNEIHRQLIDANMSFEIICVDDASKSTFNIHNEKVNSLSNTKFISNKQNLGYSSNRNFLVSLSKFNNLIFIDGDSEIIDTSYTDNYLKAISDDDNDIIYGGRMHPDFIENPNKKLRWKYGKFVESKPANIRAKRNYNALMFNNTFIKKSVFNAIKFDPITDKYGHDDTLFAYKASLAKLKVKHIDNAVMHADIDENNAFLKKTETALYNALKLYNLNKISPDFVKILKLYALINTLKIRPIVAFLHKIFKVYIKKKLNSSNPSLLLFNFYKIGFLCSLTIDED